MTAASIVLWRTGDSAPSAERVLCERDFAIEAAALVAAAACPVPAAQSVALWRRAAQWSGCDGGVG